MLCFTNTISYCLSIPNHVFVMLEFCILCTVRLQHLVRFVIVHSVSEGPFRIKDYILNVFVWVTYLVPNYLCNLPVDRYVKPVCVKLLLVKFSPADIRHY